MYTLTGDYGLAEKKVDGDDSFPGEPALEDAVFLPFAGDHLQGFHEHVTELLNVFTIQKTLRACKEYLGLFAMCRAPGC